MENGYKKQLVNILQRVARKAAIVAIDETSDKLQRYTFDTSLVFGTAMSIKIAPEFASESAARLKLWEELQEILLN